MNIFKILRGKPWQPAVAGEALEYDGPNPQVAAQIALRFLLAVIGVLFFLFIITFLSRSQYPDFEALAGAPWQPFTDTSRLWLNTALLACASVGMHFALLGSRKGKMNTSVIGISAAVLFTVAFLYAQYELWLHLQSMGYYIDSNPANSYFYLLTAVHGLHMIGGLIVLANVVFSVWKDNRAETLGAPLKLCATYWHFLLGVWLVLFALLTSSPETINTLAAMCGF